MYIYVCVYWWLIWYAQCFTWCNLTRLVCIHVVLQMFEKFCNTRRRSKRIISITWAELARQKLTELTMVLFRIRGSIGSIGFASLKWPICPDVIDVSRIYMDLSCFIPICPEWCRCSLRQIAAQPLFCPVHWRELLTQPLRWRDDQKRPQRCLGLRKSMITYHYIICK